MFDLTQHIEFAQPQFLFLLLLLPLMVAWYWYNHQKMQPEINVSTTEHFSLNKKTKKQILFHLLFVLRMLVIGLLIIVLARPQSSKSSEDLSIEGIDIVLTIDISQTMQAEDFRPNRLEAAKDVASQFIDKRPNDRIGLVVFSGRSFTQCPLTIDHAVLKNLFKGVKTGMIDDERTAIGSGLGTSISRIKDSKAISKVIILLTDGMNNTGELDPLTAAEMAKVFGIRIYTIGVGTYGEAPFPVPTPFGIQYQNIKVEIDEPLLKQIANNTNGKYFRATDKKQLENIYTEIDKLEKSKIDVLRYSHKKEEFLFWALLAGVLFLLEIILKNTVFRSIP